jgi:hypothetical protein
VPVDAVTEARAVRGVTRAQARVWGVASIDDSTVTVMGVQRDTPTMKMAPGRGQAWFGPSTSVLEGDRVTLRAAGELQVVAQGVLPSEVGLVGDDLVFLDPDDARSLLGLAPETCSDLALWVYHDGEAEALRPDLKAALSFPSVIVTRDETLGASRAQIEHAAGLRTALLVPALLALILLATAVVRLQLGGRREMALLKTLGWTTTDLVRLHGFRALLVAVPAAGIGSALAYAVVFVPELDWARGLIYGWLDAGPTLVLTTRGALTTLVQVVALTVAPFLAAATLPVLGLAGSDPEQWLRGREQ